MNGEEFLNKLYKDLNLSDEVMHTAKGTKNKDEAVKRYMDRLETIHNQAIKKEIDIDKLKHLYHKKYVVKENNIPNYRDKERIIKTQEESLDKWLDYLLDENAKYPMWAKYWVFQGMLKIGTYDEANDVYQRRSKKTLAPFIEANPEIIAKCIGLVTEYIGKKEIDDSNLQLLVESGNFQKLYTLLLGKKKEILHNASNPGDGIWITYHHETNEEVADKEKKGIIPEYLKLYNSLQGYNTGWCTAGDKETAKDQVCGISSYVGGDFHVYYTKDELGEYKIPRIAIRMNKDNIGEIKGIAENQNVEDGFEDIIAKKLETLPNISKEDANKYLKIINNMKKLTLLNRKNKVQEEFTEEDIKFIYELDEKIEGFGWDEDPRIKKIISTRDIRKDVNRSSEIALKTMRKDGNLLTYVNKNIEGYREIALEAVKRNGIALEYVDKNIEDYREIALEAVKQNGFALKYVDKNVEGYREIALAAVRKDGNALRYVDKDIKGYEKIAMEAVKQNGNALQYIDKDINDYKEIALEAVKQDGMSLYYVDKNIEGYREIAMEAVKQDGRSLKYVDKNIEGYREIALEAVKQDGMSLYYVDKNIEGYREIALEAVRNDGNALRYVDKNIEGYKELALEAVRNNGEALWYVDKNIEGYKEIALETVKKNGDTLVCVDKNIDGYREIALEAVKNNGTALAFVDKNIENYKELALEAVKKRGIALAHVDENIEGYKEIALEAVKNDSFVLKFIDKDIEGYREIALEALKNDYNVLRYIDKNIEGYKELAQEATNKIGSR